MKNWNLDFRIEGLDNTEMGIILGIIQFLVEHFGGTMAGGASEVDDEDS